MKAYSDYEREQAVRADSEFTTYRHQDFYEQEVPRRRGGLAVLALLVAVVVLLGSLGGVYIYSRRMNSQQETSRREVSTQQSPVAMAEPVVLTADLDSRNKHFSLEEAASLAPTTGDEAMSIVSIAELVKPAVVAITTDVSVQYYYGQTYTTQAAGSGFILTHDGYIVTNNHVIENATRINVQLEDGRTYDASLVGSDEQSDLAVLKIEESDLPVVVLGESASLQVGELAVAIGNPAGRFSGTVTAGIVSALNRQVEGFDISLIQTDATINPGNSGGVLLNSFGEVVGINTLKYYSTSISSQQPLEGLGFAIPIDEAKPLIEELIRDGKVRRPSIGIQAAALDEYTASLQNLVPGILIRQLTPAGAAMKAGLQVGDIIIRFADSETLTIDDLLHARDSHSIGDEVEVVVNRAGQELTFTLVLDEG